jgi:hypothetical protein
MSASGKEEKGRRAAESKSSEVMSTKAMPWAAAPEVIALRVRRNLFDRSLAPR